ncbi:MAG: hypothetical protein H0T52_07090, partial [Lautropia sp.]|nr:hypothetical protein [Lautropia sp.]
NTAGQISGVGLVVRDNGPGFAPAMMARVFEPYVSSKAKGTGLGLVIVRKIIQDHGGRVEVGNRPEPFALPEVAPDRSAKGASAVPGAYVHVLFAKLEKNDDNFSVPATENPVASMLHPVQTASVPADKNRR